jgi:hypothetical protein
MTAKIFNFSAFFLTVTLLVFSSCKKQFDEPPITELPNLESNTTIADLIVLAAPTPVALGTQIIEATVIADDQSGNFYKQLVIQDSTGGIRIDIDAYDIYTDFPIGRKVWIKCAGLYVWQDGDVPAIIASSNTNDSRLPQSTYKQFIIGGAYDQPLAPTVKSLTNLSAADYHTLIQLDNVEFADCFAGGTYAFPSTQESKNAELTDCATGATLIVRNSGFASFSGEYMPTGNGSLVAVFNSFGGTPQLFIRNPADVETMTGTRCNPLASYAAVSVDALRGQYSGSPAVALGKIQGVVISDAAGGQWQSQNLVIQEPNGSGITVRFTDDHNYAVNDYIEIKVGGGTLEEFNGLLQVNNIPACRSTNLMGSATITPRTATVADIIANANDWESTLINVQNASLNGGTTYGDFGVMLNDNTGSIDLFSGFSNFTATPLPTGTGDVTAVIGDYNGTQLNIRNTYDVNIGGGTGGGGGGSNLNQISILDARNLYSGSPTNAADTTKIVGVVISDLVGGNWQPSNLVVQEPGGSGIVIRFASNHSFNQGDEVEIDISNQTIEEYNGLLQINGVPNNNATLLSSGNTISPRVATVADINSNADDWESTLIQVMNANLNGGTTYGDFGIMLNDASGSISMFSAFANFATTAIPTGTGDVTGVVGDFNGVQINIRNTTDVNISGSGGGGGTTTTLPIADIRALYTGVNTSVPAATAIAGIVISDKDEGNITAKNIVIQNSNGAGIIVRFSADNSSIAMGDSINIDISAASISEFNGLLQVSGISNANATVLSSGNSITPRIATTADITTNAEAWESTLIKINNATITGTTYSGTTTVTDAAGTIDMYTRSAATFSGTTVASGTVTITAIVSQFTSYQLNIRTLADIQ